jgi:antitoxin MazE
MKTSIVQIGNSKGVRIPKALLEQLKFEQTVEFEILPEGLLLRPVKEENGPEPPRGGWTEMFRQALREEGDDAAQFADWNRSALTEFEETEW